MREGEAPAEPFWIRILWLRGSTGTSPSRINDERIFFTASGQ